MRDGRRLDGQWLNLRGVALGIDGATVNSRERYVLLVWLDALHRQLPLVTVVTANEADTDAGSQPDEGQERNDLLRQARLRTPSPNCRTWPMSQRELAEAVTAHVQRTTGRDVALDRHYISRLERGRSRWPIADYRDAFRAVLGVATDAELGFYIKRRAPLDTRPDAHLAASTPMAVVTTGGLIVRPTGSDGSAAQLAVNPGPAVILVPATPEL